MIFPVLPPPQCVRLSYTGQCGAILGIHTYCMCYLHQMHAQSAITHAGKRPVTSQALCTHTHIRAHMKIRPDKHTCIFSLLHHEKKNCYVFSFHILGFQGWMR